MPIIQKLTSKSRVDGTVYLGDYTFKNGNCVPLYDIQKMSAFNQLIGHAKYINHEYGNVYYRGVDDLYDNVMPALLRSRAKGNPTDLIEVMNSVTSSPYFKESLKLFPITHERNLSDKINNKKSKRYNKYIVESLLQHYAGSTRFIDLVDNHWVSLWMGLHRFIVSGKKKQFCTFEKKTVPLEDYYETLVTTGKYDIDTLNHNIYLYILLLAFPYSKESPIRGIEITNEFIVVDLRKALPSFYLRPHAQHAWVAKRKEDHDSKCNNANYYDLSSQVVGILRVRLDRASMWLGEGALLTKENLFPSPALDQGYNNLLMHPEIFKNPFEIWKYY